MASKKSKLRVSGVGSWLVVRFREGDIYKRRHMAEHTLVDLLWGCSS